MRGTKMEKKSTASAISPKVIASTVTSIALIVIVAVVSAVTPELFAGLGQYGPLAYAAVVALGGAVAGYLKGDPLRG
jgi:Na+-translocating ferredoxin:NAD+ oxidoreductase RnfE subunit